MCLIIDKNISRENIMRRLWDNFDNDLNSVVMISACILQDLVRSVSILHWKLHGIVIGGLTISWYLQCSGNSIRSNPLFFRPDIALSQSRRHQSMKITMKTQSKGFDCETGCRLWHDHYDKRDLGVKDLMPSKYRYLRDNYNRILDYCMLIGRP